MKYFFTAFCCFAFLALFAQPNLPKGIFLQNKTSGLPVQDASVFTSDGLFSETSDENGYVKLNTLPATADSIHVSCVGFEPLVIPAAPMQTTPGQRIVISLTPKLTQLSEVVVKATARAGIFKTISDLDIHLRPIANSQEVLRMVPGLFIGQHAGGGKAEQIFLRGFDLDHGTDINIKADGIPVNMVSHAHGQGYADLHFLIPELIGKVNFNKGPYFADKGNFTTAGYVDFSTKNHLEKNFLKLEGGQYATARAVAGLNLLPKANSQEQSWYTAAEGSYTKGYFESPQHFNRLNIFTKYHGLVSRHTYLTASASAFTSKWNASGQIPDRAVANGTIGFFGAIDNDEGGKTSRYNANLILKKILPNGASWQQQLFYSKYLFELYSNFTFFREDSVNGDQIRQKENRDIFGYNTFYEKNHSLFRLPAHFKAGAEIRYDNIKGLELSRTLHRSTTTAALSKGNVNELNAGIYAEEKIQLHPKTDLTAGLRGDLFTNKFFNRLNDTTLTARSLILSPSIKISHRLSDNAQLYWYVGKNFHSNDTRVAVAKNGRDVVTPAYGSDIGSILKLGNRALLQAAVWYLWMQQEFVYVGDEAVIEPGGKTQRFGVDLSLRYELLRNLYADADINWAHPRALGEPTGQNYLPLAPVFTSTGGFTYRKEMGWNGSLRYRYMANRPANEDNSIVAKGYFITDAAINYTQKKWEAGIAIQNVFNTRWKETQFATESRLKNEPDVVNEIHFTPGTPFFARLAFTLFF